MRCGVEGKPHSHITEVPREEIEIKGIGDSSRFLYDDDSCRCSAETVCRRQANCRCEELGVIGEDVVDGCEINVVGESGQVLKGGCSADGFEVNSWDDLCRKVAMSDGQYCSSGWRYDKGAYSRTKLGKLSRLTWAASMTTRAERQTRKGEMRM
jgi:hypothetical protein